MHNFASPLRIFLLLLDHIYFYVLQFLDGVDDLVVALLHQFKGLVVAGLERAQLRLTMNTVQTVIKQTLPRNNFKAATTSWKFPPKHVINVHSFIRCDKYCKRSGSKLLQYKYLSERPFHMCHSNSFMA